MKTWLRRIGAALIIPVYWFLGGFALGLVMEGVDPHGELVDIWPAVFALPGFAGGLLFVGLLAIAERRRRYAEIPARRGVIWGAVAALLPLALCLQVMGGLTGPNRLEALSIAISMGALTLLFPLAGGLTVALARKMAAAF